MKWQVYRVNRECVDLYESTQLGTRDLNERLINIEGGVGVFSALQGQ